ncbi:MAG: hypothetical protein CMC36_00655 [Flavobacteriaceae bacterium]|nr:hypothetical protein [Flavobacteriaceae bacterium]|tara:strand:- start:6990 stop:8627 length:1638 start_codon:yes stop_codon:yes gene_type:complete
MKFNLFKILLIVLVIASCEKDFASFDSQVINSENAINFSTNSVEYNVTSRSKMVNPVQTNNLPSFLLGSYNHPQYGRSNSNFVGQMVPSEYNHEFGENVVLDSVVLTIPYFSRGVDTSEDGDITYELDSVYGDSPIKISVYKNNFFFRSFDPYSDFDTSQSYFSNGSLSVEEVIDSGQLEAELLFEIDEFIPSNKQINLTEIDTSGNTYVSQKLAPALRFKLNNPNENFWESNFFENEGNSVLTNEPNFKEFFRGLYFKVESNTEGSLMLLNFASSNTKLTIHYTSDNTSIGDSDTGSVDEIETNQHEYTINFTGNLMNIFENENPIDVGLLDQSNGNENIYLRGGEGIISTLDLFSGTTIDDDGEEISEFDLFKDFFYDDIIDEPIRIINEAYIEFFVNQNFSNNDEPERIYLYNYEQNSALIDYFLDQSVSSLTINAKINHLEPLVRDSLDDDRGIKYKIRITEHLNNLILRDSTNAKLALAVISDVGSVQNFKILSSDSESENKSLASGVILSPKGTILHGNLSLDLEKRPKIKIYYTEPED